MAAGFTGFLLVSTAAWWSWDGTAGWGPRLLVPLVPLLAAISAPRRGGSCRSSLFRVLFAGGIGVNLLGALQPDAADDLVLLHPAEQAALPGRKVPMARFTPARRIPRPAEPRSSPLHEVARNAAFSPIRLHAFLLAGRVAEVTSSGAIRQPPWRTDLPGQEIATPLERAIPASALVFLSSPFRWPHLAMS